MTLVLTLLVVFTMAIAITVTEAEADEVEDHYTPHIIYLSRNKKQKPASGNTEEQKMLAEWGRGFAVLNKHIMAKRAARKKGNCVSLMRRCYPGLSVCCEGSCQPWRGRHYCT